jgi:hypothetical protein
VPMAAIPGTSSNSANCDVTLCMLVLIFRVIYSKRVLLSSHSASGESEGFYLSWAADSELYKASTSVFVKARL